MGLSNAERQANKYLRTKQKLAEVEGLKKRVAELEAELDQAVAERVSGLSPHDVLRAFRKMTPDQQGILLGGLWSIISERVGSSLNKQRKP